MSFAVPDTAGFIAADKAMRSQFGNPIIFSVPTEPQWPSGTRINPDTNEPYSAMVVQQNVAFTFVTVVCSVILKQGSPLRPQADTEFEPSGLMMGMDIILDVDADDFPVVQDASEFAYAARNYKVEETKPFAIANVTYRWLVYGKER
jgi:hypothetical protein